jgi:hypothetical protein
MPPARPRRSVGYNDNIDDGTEIYVGGKAELANHLYRLQILHNLSYRVALTTSRFVCDINLRLMAIQYFTKP